MRLVAIPFYLISLIFGDYYAMIAFNVFMAFCLVGLCLTCWRAAVVLALEVIVFLGGLYVLGPQWLDYLPHGQ